MNSYYHDCVRQGEIQYFLLCNMKRNGMRFSASEWNAMITRKQAGKGNVLKLGIVKTGVEFGLGITFPLMPYIPAARFSIYSCRSCHPVAKKEAISTAQRSKKLAYLRQHGP